MKLILQVKRIQFQVSKLPPKFINYIYNYISKRHIFSPFSLALNNEVQKAKENNQKNNNNRKLKKPEKYFEPKPNYVYEFGTHYKIRYNSYDLNIGKNELENSEVVMLDKIVTGFSGICTKISAIHKVDPKILTQLEVEFKKKFTQSKKDLPTLQVYITSEANSYGILFNEWLDGEEFLLTFKWVQYDDYNGLKYK